MPHYQVDFTPIYVINFGNVNAILVLFKASATVAHNYRLHMTNTDWTIISLLGKKEKRKKAQDNTDLKVILKVQMNSIQKVA